MADLAASKAILRKRVQRLLRLDRGEDDPSELRTKILPFLRTLGEVALMGGAIRDLARSGRAGFSSDLDFVVHTSSRTAFQNAMLVANAKPNRFGGYALRFHQCKVDVWHLEDTWARTAGLLRGDHVSDLLRCTFFDWDSIVFDLRTKRLIMDDDYLVRLHMGVMNLRLSHNPNPAGSLVRALRRAALWGVGFGPELSNFSREKLTMLNWSELVERDRAAFAFPVLAHLDRCELLKNLESVDEFGGTLPVPNWLREPMLPLSAGDRTSMSPIQ